MLEVLVRPDGSPAEVNIRTSSGRRSSTTPPSKRAVALALHPGTPEQRGGRESVTFPIRFRLDAGCPKVAKGRVPMPAPAGPGNAVDDPP
jgi:hypothetical protein